MKENSELRHRKVHLTRLDHYIHFPKLPTVLRWISRGSGEDHVSPLRGRIAYAAAAILGVSAGLLLAFWPLWTVFAIGTVLLLLTLACSHAVWRWCCVLLILGYVVLGRGFAYSSISFPMRGVEVLQLPTIPLYVGELVLLLCLVAMPHRTILRAYLAAFPVGWLGCWVGLGVALTIPSLTTYFLSAVRDSAMYYYAAFTYVGYTFATREEDVRWLLRMLGLAFVLHLIYTGVSFFLKVDLTALALKAPGSNFPLLTGRDDASSIHLIAGSLFVILITRHQGWPAWSRWVLGLSQTVLFFFLWVRAAYVGLFLVLLYLIYVRWLHQIVRITLVTPLLVALLAISFGISLNVTGRSGGLGQTLGNVAQLFDVFGSGGRRYSGLDTAAANVRWRLEYWQEIIEQGTQTPSRFLFGLGFGPELSTSPKFVVDPSRPNRNPHNIAVNVFGRMGIVGLMLWVAFHVAFFRKVSVGLSGNRGSPMVWRYDCQVFLTAYIVMILGTALFGVILESPFTAIPYYFFMGASLRVASERLESSQPAVPVAATR